MKKKLISFFISMIILATFVLAQEEDIKFGNFEVDKLLNLGSAILAVVLFMISITAYRRDKRKRMLFVAVAFLIFSIKGFILSSEIFIPDMAEAGWVDPLTSVLDFGILLSFFSGLMKK